MLGALRQALCPLPALSVLLQATSQGQLNLAESHRQKRQPQLEGLEALFRGWFLG